MKSFTIAFSFITRECSCSEMHSQTFVCEGVFFLVGVSHVCTYVFTHICACTCLCICVYIGGTNVQLLLLSILENVNVFPLTVILLHSSNPYGSIDSLPMFGINDT